LEDIAALGEQMMLSGDDSLPSIGSVIAEIEVWVR
jgi:hypothetical protein